MMYWSPLLTFDVVQCPSRTPTRRSQKDVRSSLWRGSPSEWSVIGLLPCRLPWPAGAPPRPRALPSLLWISQGNPSTHSHMVGSTSTHKNVNVDSKQQRFLFNSIYEVHVFVSTKCNCEMYCLNMSWFNWINICWHEQNNTYISSSVVLQWVVQFNYPGSVIQHKYMVNKQPTGNFKIIIYFSSPQANYGVAVWNWPIHC